MSDQSQIMLHALELAKKGEGWTLPNPMVGAVIVKDGKIIGEGYHKGFGEDHAEIEALKNVNAKGATLFVTLEPCDHHGKTPPCTEAIIKNGIKNVIIASKDPNRNGIQALQKAGIEVETGFLEEDANKLNEAFFLFHSKKRPYITLKVASSLDWKIAKSRDEQTILTGKATQKEVHKLRHKHQAILVGSGTVIADNPHLGVREINGRDPIRVILTGDRELPKNSIVFRDNNYLEINQSSIGEILNELYQKNIVSLLVEGGNQVFSTFLNAGFADNLEIFIAPTLLGENALKMANLDEKLSLLFNSVQKLEQDLWINATPKWDSNNG